MAEPKCPSCNAQGIENILTAKSKVESDSGHEWFNIVYCYNCGHVYGVFAKHVLSHDIPPIPEKSEFR